MSARHLTNWIIIVKVRKGKVYSHYTSTFAVFIFLGNKMEEIWKDIVGYEGYYQVSNFGNVRSIDRKDGRGGRTYV